MCVDRFKQIVFSHIFSNSYIFHIGDTDISRMWSPN